MAIEDACLGNISDLVRKLGSRYDGGRNPLLFIDRAEEIAEMYNINKNYLPIAIPEFLEDKALIWFINNNKNWNQWESFKTDFSKFFLPARYFEHLEDEIKRRCQRHSEPFKDYVLAIQNLMQHSQMTEEEKLERIYKNSHPTYLWYIHRRDFNNLSDLLALTDDLESTPIDNSSKIE